MDSLRTFCHVDHLLKPCEWQEDLQGGRFQRLLARAGALSLGAWRPSFQEPGHLHPPLPLHLDHLLCQRSGLLKAFHVGPEAAIRETLQQNAASRLPDQSRHLLAGGGAACAAAARHAKGAENR